MPAKTQSKLHTAETAMLLALCITLLLALWGRRDQTLLSESLIRLHVIAVSDDSYEQELKLRVRDAVLLHTQELLEGITDAQEAGDVLSGNLSSIKAAAESAAEGRAVRVTLSEESYPTRYYEGFALPAGRYNSLRVMLGEAGGQNWWCVIFPPLCTAASADAAQAALGEQGKALVTQDGTEYVLRFRAMELWGELRNALGG
ncbi:MAG: stage II sporulation protein R [Candidatus Heteroscillospira sp.]|jgi:stage II sporulation protein R